MSVTALKAYKLFLMPGGNAVTISKSLTRTAAGSSGIYRYLNLTPNVWFNFYADEFKGIHKEAVEVRGSNGTKLDQYWENGPQLSGWGEIVGRYPDGTPAITEGTSGNGWGHSVWCTPAKLENSDDLHDLARCG